MSQQMVIDSSVFAREARLLHGELAVADLRRVHDTLVEIAGKVSYRLQGRMGPQGRPQLLLQIDGELPLRCQRCLEQVSYPLHVDSVLELIDSENDLTEEELEDDSRDFLPIQKELDVAALIEDEIILALQIGRAHV